MSTLPLNWIELNWIAPSRLQRRNIVKPHPQNKVGVKPKRATVRNSTSIDCWCIQNLPILYYLSESLVRNPVVCVPKMTKRLLYPHSQRGHHTDGSIGQWGSEAECYGGKWLAPPARNTDTSMAYGLRLLLFFFIYVYNFRDRMKLLSAVNYNHMALDWSLISLVYTKYGQPTSMGQHCKKYPWNFRHFTWHPSS